MRLRHASPQWSGATLSRALTEAGREFPDAAQVLVSETDAPPGMAIPKTVEIVPVWRFLF